MNICKRFALFALFAIGALCAEAQVGLIVEDIQIDCGENFIIEIQVTNFTDIQSVQFSLAFDPAVLEYVDFTNVLGQGFLSVNETMADNGILIVSWANGVPITLPDGSVIFTLEFNHIGDCGSPTAIEITGDPTSIEIVNPDGPTDYTLEMGIVAFSPCDVTVDAGEDATACFPGGDVQLDASIDGFVTSFEWTPAAGLSDPQALDPVATVNGPVTYTLTANSVSDNLIYNPGFEEGNTGFTSDYTYDLTGLILNGTYITIESPALISASFPPCVDHTSGSGQMMVVNGGNTPGEEVWCQSVSVEPGTDYLLSMWVSTVIPVAPAELQFYINGLPVGAVHSPTNMSCDWVQFTEAWNSGSETSAEICIVSQSTAMVGNDFALDDIGFFEICQSSDEIQLDVADEILVEIDTTLCSGQGFTVGGNNYTETGSYQDILSSADGCDSTVMLDLTVIETQAVIDAGGELNCILDQWVIDGSQSTSGPDISYVWSTPNGNIVSGQGTNAVTVDAAGVYQLVVGYDDGEIFCSSTPALTVVTIDTTSPQVDILNVPVLTCAEPEAVIETAPAQAGYEVFWSTSDGNILTGGNTFNPIVDQPGTYTMEVTDPGNGCISEYGITVESGINFPQSIIQGDTVIGCSLPEVVLDGSASTMDAAFVYNWFTMDGNITVDTGGFMITADAPGTYFFAVSDTASGCADTSSVGVIADFQVTQIFINSPPELNCLNTDLTIEAGINEDTSRVDIRWTTLDGHIVSGADGLSPVVDQPGQYTITVTRISNQCLNQASVEIISDMDVPQVEAGEDDTLNCTDVVLMLDGTGTDTGPTIFYRWESQDGNIVAGTNTLQPEIDQPGLYVLNVIDSSNFCTTTDSVRIHADENTPDVSIQVYDTLDCATDTVTLYSEGSDRGPDFLYEWGTVDGNILSGTGADTVLADSGGAYFLRITNTQNMCVSQSSLFLAVDRVAPQVEAGDTAFIDCQDPRTRLTGTAMSDGSIAIRWSTPDGNILAGADSLAPLVDREGVYILTATDLSNGCIARDSVYVISLDEIPLVEVSSPHGIDCETPTTSIHSPGSDSGPEFRYTWSTADGNILSPLDGDSILVDRGGTYVLQIENTATGCIGSAGIEIGEDTRRPFVTAGPDLEISCPQPVAMVDADSSDHGPGFVFEWRDENGDLLPLDSLSFKTSTAGTFILRVRDTSNQCTAADTVSVGGDTIAPSLRIALPDTITCRQPEVILDASGSSEGPPFEIRWSTTDGNIVSGAQGLQATADRPGTYTLLIRNLENECEAGGSVNIEADTVHPVVSAGQTDTLSCLQPDLLLSGTATPPDGNYTWQWTTQDGNITSDPDLREVTVDMAGNYILEVTNEENGCTGTGQVTIFADAGIPVANAGGDRLLPCTGEGALLDGTNSSMGPGISYRWTSPDGSISGPDDQATATAGAAGQYILNVTDSDNGCAASDTAEVIFRPIQDAGLALDHVNCNETTGSVSVISVTGGSAPFAYALDDTTGFGPEDEFSFVAPGIHTLYIRDSVECRWQREFVLRADTGFLLSLPAQITLRGGDTVTLPTATDLDPGAISSIVWSPAIDLSCIDCLRPVHTASRPLTLTITVTDTTGCTRSASVRIMIDRPGEIYIPNAFSPNGDGINDLFELYSVSENVRIQSLRIFDRWGNQVFERTMIGITDPALAWDGRFNGKDLAPGLYVYHLVLSRFEGEYESYKGEIYLVR